MDQFRLVFSYLIVATFLLNSAFGQQICTSIPPSITSVNTTIRGSTFFPVGSGRFSPGSFGGVQWFQYTSDPCNGTANYTAPSVDTLLKVYADNLTQSFSGLSLSGVGLESFPLTSAIKIGNQYAPYVMTFGGTVYVDVHLGTRDGCFYSTPSHNSPPCLNDIVNQGINTSNINFQLTDPPSLLFFDGNLAGVSISIIYPALPTSNSQLQSRLTQTGYSDYFKLTIDGPMWNIANYNASNHKIQASGFFDFDTPCNAFNTTQSAVLCKDLFISSPVF